MWCTVTGVATVRNCCNSKGSHAADAKEKQLYLHVMAVHEAMHNLLQEEARLGLGKALALPDKVQQGSSLRQLHHLHHIHMLNARSEKKSLKANTGKKPQGKEKKSLRQCLSL